MNEAQALFTLVNKMFDIVKENDDRWSTGLVYRGNTSRIVSTTWFGAFASATWEGRM